MIMIDGVEFVVLLIYSVAVSVVGDVRQYQSQ